MKKMLLPVTAFIVLCMFGNPALAEGRSVGCEIKKKVSGKCSVETKERAARKTGKLEGVKKVDVNVSAAKVKTAKCRFLSQFDLNRDGVVDPVEKETVQKERQARQEAILRKYDKNGDGKLDKAERVAVRYDDLFASPAAGSK